ncbi:MAG TPA: energy transducer TonB, partial [Thermoanaerobaculia bacterium]|nr:energy transducer TonB [Thermoanaerobaculia bacterium]
ATVSFPKNAPDEFAIPLIAPVVSIPPPLGNPNATGQQQKPAQPPQQKQAAAPLPTQPVAPPVIPDNVTPVDSASSTTGTETAGGPATGDSGPIGVPWGTDGSIGSIDAPPATTTQVPVENKIYTVGEVKAPVILRRVEPLYPGVLQRARLAGKVAIHCVIDKNGRVRDAEVVFASHPAFADSVQRALKEWRYQPASLRGEAVDCYLDLTVDFGVR